MSEEQHLIERAQAGEREAFDALVQPHTRQLRGVIRRLIGHPEDTDDCVQDTLVKAFDGIVSYRGESRFSTWLCAIGVRTAMDHLRRQKQWRARAQVIYANECYRSEALSGEVDAALTAPDFNYDVREHIAYCFTCVGRSLPPEQHAALVLRELMELTNREAAQALDVSVSILRHRLAAARKTMEETFEGLCVLVNKNGVCYQCKGLRDGTPAAQRGPEIPVVRDFIKERLPVVKNADIDGGRCQALHNLFFRRTAEIEARGVGDADALPLCDIERTEA